MGNWTPRSKTVLMIQFLMELPYIDENSQIATHFFLGIPERRTRNTEYRMPNRGPDSWQFGVIFIPHRGGTDVLIAPAPRIPYEIDQLTPNPAARPVASIVVGT